MDLALVVYGFSTYNTMCAFSVHRIAIRRVMGQQLDTLSGRDVTVADGVPYGKVRRNRGAGDDSRVVRRSDCSRTDGLHVKKYAYNWIF